MRKVIINIVVVAAAFILGAAGMAFFLATGNTDSTGEMAGASLPYIYLEQDGRLFNLLHGYTGETDASSVRDAVMPLREDRRVGLDIVCPDTRISRILYEVRSTDTSRLIEDGEIEDFTRTDGEISVQFQLKDLFDEGEEYLLVIRLVTNRDQEISYYTRLANPGDTYLKECLEFAETIHDALFDKENTVNITSYLETDLTSDSSSLSHVNINSRYKQVIWADMDVVQEGETKVFITETEPSITSFRLEFNVSYVNEDGEKELYGVTESYRVRYTQQRMYLLAYDRSVDRIFDPDLDIFTDSSLQLGILDTEVEYRKNEAENIVAFVQNGQLWCYDTAQNKLSLVFGFREGDDPRGSFGDHEIRILSIDESGSMIFMIYGYMNRGIHEGETGLAVYSYDALTSSVEEYLFLNSSLGYGSLKSQVGALSYVNSRNRLYLYFDENIICLNLDDRTYEVVVSGIDQECCLSSEDGRFVALHRGNSLYGTQTLTVLDLETGESRDITARNGYYIRALGFMGTDFIYGEARQSDVTETVTGGQEFPMGLVIIEDKDGGVIREFDYEGLGKYVYDIEIDSNRISLFCVARAEDGTFVEADPEPITNKTQETEEKISLETRNDSVKKKEYYFNFSGGRGEKNLKVLTPRQVLFDEDRSLTLKEESEDDRYYVYSYDGSFAAAFPQVSDAVEEAYDVMGVVVDREQNYIWQRGARKTITSISGLENPQQKAEETSLEAALEILLGTQNTYCDVAYYLSNGFTPYEILSEQMSGSILDLSGCSVSMVLYYVSRGYPVLALEGEGEAELITGYDQQNIILMDTLTQETYRMGMNDSTEMFRELGNSFLVCVEDI